MGSNPITGRGIRARPCGQRPLGVSTIIPSLCWALNGAGSAPFEVYGCKLCWQAVRQHDDALRRAGRHALRCCPGFSQVMQLSACASLDCYSGICLLGYYSSEDGSTASKGTSGVRVLQEKSVLVVHTFRAWLDRCRPS